jgi:hypothetical protein
MTRDEALELLDKTNYPEDLRKQDHEFIAKKLGVSVAELEAIFERPPVDYSEYPNSESSSRRLFAFTAAVGALLRKLRILR